jgi:hypothetical protein
MKWVVDLNDNCEKLALIVNGEKIWVMFVTQCLNYGQLWFDNLFKA